MIDVSQSNANVAGTDLVITFSTGDQRLTVFSAVAAKLFFNGDTVGLTVAAGGAWSGDITGYPNGATCTLTADSGNLGRVEVTIESGMTVGGV